MLLLNLANLSKKHNKHYLKQFQRLFEPNCQVEEAYDILCSLNPSSLSTAQLIDILRWVEKSALKLGKFPNHVNIFGTGGDCSNDIFGKTLNISSLSATIASQVTTVIKVGTRAVTAKWGSADFFRRSAEIAKKESFPFVLKSPSRFIDLRKFGFKYSNNIIQARKRIFAENRLDIFKVIFPFANLTNSYGQVNGISRLEYIPIFSALASQYPNSKILLIHNKNGHDELLSGENHLRLHYQGEVIKFNLEIENVSPEIENLLHEKDNLDEQILTAKYLLENEKTKDFFLEILCFNAAAIVFVSSSNYYKFSSFILKDIKDNLKEEFAKNYDNTHR